MEMTIVIPLGASARVEVRGDSQREVVEMAAFFQELPTACPVCEAPVQFTARHPQGYDYYGMRCTGRPAHETTFGAHREGGTLYYKASEPWVVWQPGVRAEDDRAGEQTSPAPARGASVPPRGAQIQTAPLLSADQAQEIRSALAGVAGDRVRAFLAEFGASTPGGIPSARFADAKAKAERLPRGAARRAS